MSAVSLAIPSNLAAGARRSGGGERWLGALTAAVEQARVRWDLAVGDPFEPGGNTAWVAPVRDGRGRDLVLKLLWKHYEADHEADALRLWDGEGAVRVHEAADIRPEAGGTADTTALLLERCRPGTALLRARPEPEWDEVLTRLLRRLWIVPPAGHVFRPLASMCDQWADEFEAKQAAGRAPIDPGLARAGMTLMRTLPASAERSVLLCTDLHAGNVLAAEREPWLAIDPKPYVGDPTYDVTQHLFNCTERLPADPHGLARRVADLAGLDGDRVLLWLFARCVQESPEHPTLADVARRLAPG